MPLGEEAEILVHQPVEQLALVFGDDGVADARQDHRLEIGRGSACTENRRW